MYRRYAEIVHYRAPYRDQLVGCGQTVSDAATSEIGRRGYVEKGADGISRLRANYAQDFLQLLSSGFEVVMQGDTGYVTKKDPLLGTTLIPCPTATLGGASQPMGDAQAWVKSQLEDGRAVLTSLVSVVARQPMCSIIRSVPVTDVERMKIESSSWPVLAEPSGVQQTTSMLGGGLAVAAAVAGIVGVVAWMAGLIGQKKSYIKNERAPETVRSPGSWPTAGWIATDGVLIYGAGTTREEAESSAHWDVVRATPRLMEAIRRRGGDVSWRMRKTGVADLRTKGRSR